MFFCDGMVFRPFLEDVPGGQGVFKGKKINDQQAQRRPQMHLLVNV
jgi:hypothetical protein